MPGSQQIVTDWQVERLHIRETDFRILPISVRMLMLDYSKSEPSGQDGSIVLEMHAYRWPEIESELQRASAIEGTTQEPGRLTRTALFAIDYECATDHAAWSLVECTSVRKERCPVCHRKVRPVNVERYVVVEWMPAPPSWWSRFRNWLH